MKKLLLAAGLLLAGLNAKAQTLTFAPAVQYFVNASPNDLATADFNEDGYIDIATATSGSAVRVLLNRQNGTFAAAVTYTAALNASVYAVAAADLTNDGYPDIVTTSAGSPGLAVLINQKNGTFAPAVFYVGGGLDLTLSDVDKDGYPDIVTFTNGLPAATVFLNQGNGTFATAVAYATGSLTPSRLAVGDINADGYPDVAVAEFGGGIGLLLNNKNGTFGSFSTYTTATGRKQRGIALRDLNGDGYADLLVIDSSDNTAKVGLNTRNGTFSQLVSYATGTDPESLTVADMNGDGYPDLITGNANNNAAGVLLNTQTGVLRPVTTYSTGTNGNVSSVEVADVNRDGKPDILAANAFLGSVGVLLNATTLAARTALFAQAQTSVFPNPASSAWQLTVNNLPAGVQHVDMLLSDAVGRPVQHASLPVTQGTLQAVLSTVHLTPGLYLLQLTGRDAQGFAVGMLPAQRLSLQ